MTLKKLMKNMVKIAMNEGEMNLGGNGAQQFFDGMAGENHKAAHNMAHNQAIRDMNAHMNTVNSFAAHNMMHGPHF
ncbi:MAG: hypothetical protein IKL62_07210 [Clostridia bacterium]|nr:hypothetical protein [Clostridia bacterium]